MTSTLARVLNEPDDVVRALVERLHSEPMVPDDVGEGERWRSLFDDVMERFGGDGGVQGVGVGPGALDVMLAEPNDEVERQLRTRYGADITIRYGHVFPTRS